MGITSPQSLTIMLSLRKQTHQILLQRRLLGNFTPFIWHKWCCDYNVSGTSYPQKARLLFNCISFVIEKVSLITDFKVSGISFVVVISFKMHLNIINPNLNYAYLIQITLSKLKSSSQNGNLYIRVNFTVILLPRLIISRLLIQIKKRSRKKIIQ